MTIHLLALLPIHTFKGKSLLDFSPLCFYDIQLKSCLRCVMKLWFLPLSALLCACSNGMSVNIAPPECSVSYNSEDCRTTHYKPSAMTEEDFFQPEAD